MALMWRFKNSRLKTRLTIKLLTDPKWVSFDSARRAELNGTFWSSLDQLWPEIWLPRGPRSRRWGGGSPFGLRFIKNTTQRALNGTIQLSSMSWIRCDPSRRFFINIWRILFFLDISSLKIWPSCAFMFLRFPSLPDEIRRIRDYFWNPWDKCFQMSYCGVKSINIWPKEVPYCAGNWSSLKAMCPKVQKFKVSPRRWQCR